MNAYVSAINVYPIKSCGGTLVGRAYLDPSGFRNDRKFMVVDPSDSNFLSQRVLPKMVLIRPRIQAIPGIPLYDAGELIVSAPGMPEGRIRFYEKEEAGIQKATVWDDTCRVLDQGAQASAWFSKFLKTSCKLVRIAQDGRMHHSSAFKSSFPVNFQDGYPILIISQGSLDDLSRRLKTPIPMEQLRSRFRASIVVAGVPPYEEDKWLNRVIRIGRVEMRGVKLCQRCPTTTVDQETGECGENPWDEEPLRTLLTYRQVDDGGVIFGINCVHDTTEFINLGDSVEIFS